MDAEAWAKLEEKAKWVGGILGDAIGSAWVAVLDTIDRRTEVEREKIAFRKSSDLEWRLLYEARTREFQNIAMRLGDMVEKQYHTVR
jgi:hypothetical protein